MNSRSAALIFTVSLVLFVWSCERRQDPAGPSEGLSGVLILNEGAYQAGNAELSWYDPETGSAVGNLFAAANPGRTLGDVANHLVVRDGRVYIAVNNSGRVEVLDAATRRSVARIGLTGLPRQIAVVSDQKAYVTLQDSTVAIVDLPARAEVGRIRTGSFPEGIVASGNDVYVMNSGFGYGRSISVLDARTDAVVAELPTPDGPAYGYTLPDGRIVVVCTGASDFVNPANDTPGALLLIDPAVRRIVDTLWVVGHPGKAAVGPDGTIFLLGPGAYPQTPVWKVTATPSLSVVTTGHVDGAFYGIGVHPSRDELYLADAGSFVTNGKVHVYSTGGSAIRLLDAGIGVAPSGFGVLDP